MADILLINGDVVWDGDEICIVYNTEAIKEEAYLRAICDEGESIFYDGYGSKLFTYLGKPFSSTNKALIETEVKDILQKTERITEVLCVSLQYLEIEKQTFPCVYAKYRCEGDEKIQETTFTFKH